MKRFWNGSSHRFWDVLGMSSIFMLCFPSADLTTDNVFARHFGDGTLGPDCPVLDSLCGPPGLAVEAFSLSNW